MQNLIRNDKILDIMTRNNLYAFGKFLAASAVAGCFWTGCEKTPADSYRAVPYAYVENGSMPTSGIVSVDYTDAPEGFEIGKIADGDLGTCFATSHSSFDVVWSGDASIVAVSYSVASAGDSPECDPESWVFAGSTDNKTWKTLDSQSGVEFSGRGEEKSYEIDNGTSYKYYRLRIRSNAGSETTRIAEWGIKMSSGSVEFVDIKDRLSNLSQYFTGWSTSSVTPMGNRFENAHVATSEEIAWLQDAAENPPVEAGSISSGDYSWKACTVTLYPYGNPVPADVNQHAIGDCCLCAVLASFAYLHPDFIKSIITVSGSNYRVAMYDPDGNPMTVAVNNEFICDGNGNIAALSGKNNTATWSTVMEKALMKWEYVYKINYPIGGIGTEHAAPPFTGQGNSFAITPGSVTPAQLSRIAKTAVELGYVGIGGFTQSDVVVDDPFKSVSGHAFTIMLPQTSDALFAMRNPWGSASGSPDGKEDGVMNIYDDSTVPPMVDFRIVYPGKASDYPLMGVGPYTPPSFSGKSFWLSPAMQARYGLGQTGANAN